MHRLACALALPIVLAACATGPYPGRPGPGPEGVRPPVAVGGVSTPAHPLARSATYTCEELTTVVLTEGQPVAQVTLNSGLVLSLARRADGWYGAAPFEFGARGGDATFVNNGKAARCRVK